MNRIIIINGVPYICHKAYDIESLNPNAKGKFKISENITKIKNPYDQTININKDKIKDKHSKVKVDSKVQKFDAFDKNKIVYHSKSIKNQVDKKYIFPIKNIIANMSKWMYLLDPINPGTKYPVHKVYFDEILHSLYITLYIGAKDAFDPSSEFKYYDMTEKGLRKYLFYIIHNHPYTKEHFSKLNLSYIEMQRGISVSDPNRKIINLSSRFSGPKWEDDFIDLDALINNVVLECVKDAVAAE